MLNFEYLACLAQRLEGENVSLAPLTVKKNNFPQILRGLYSHVETEDNDILGALEWFPLGSKGQPVWLSVSNRTNSRFGVPHVVKGKIDKTLSI